MSKSPPVSLLSVPIQARLIMRAYDHPHYDLHISFQVTIDPRYEYVEVVSGANSIAVVRLFPDEQQGMWQLDYLSDYLPRGVQSVGDHQRDLLLWNSIGLCTWPVKMGDRPIAGQEQIHHRICLTQVVIIVKPDGIIQIREDGGLDLIQDIQL